VICGATHNIFYIFLAILSDNFSVITNNFKKEKDDFFLIFKWFIVKAKLVLRERRRKGKSRIREEINLRRLQRPITRHGSPLHLM
jgi:hypothetical protein